MKRRIPLIALALALVMIMSACAIPGVTTNLQEGNDYNADMENVTNTTESNGRIWPWEDPSITLPEFTGTVAEPGSVTSLKIVVMGDQSAKDAWEFFPQIAKEAGIDIKISILCMNASSNKANIYAHRWQTYKYTHYQNTGDGWETLSTSTTRTSVLKSEKWQYFVINQSIWDSGKASTINEGDNTFLAEICRSVTVDISGTKEKCLWMQTWAYEENSRNNLFNGYKDYNNDQTQMYEAICNAIQSCVVGEYYFKQKEANKVATNSLRDSVIPVGTAVQNMREAYWSDGLTRDGEYLSNTGKVLAALMLFKSLTNYDINDLELSDPVFDHARPHLGVIKESVNNAYLTPYAVTPSVYNTAE